MPRGMMPTDLFRLVIVEAHDRGTVGVIQLQVANGTVTWLVTGRKCSRLGS